MTVVLVALVASVVVAPAAAAATTASITGLHSLVGYNSATLSWTPPSPRGPYRGVTVWRQEGNVDGATPVLVATLGTSVTTYRDSGLTKPSSGVWLYTVYTRDSVAGPVNPQTTSGWVTAAMSGRVTDAQGNGLGNVLVEVGPSAWSGGQTRTAADGTWLVDGQSSNAEQACFDPRDAVGGSSTTGYQPECYDDVASVPYYDSPPGRALPMTIGALTAGVDAVLAPAGAVSGVARDLRGHRLANVGVTVSRDDGRVSRQTVTGSDGSYRVVGLAPGNYSGCAYQPYGAPAVTPASPFGYLTTCSGGVTDGPGRTYAVSAGAVAGDALVLADGGVVTGQLLDPDGAPLAGELPRLGGTYAPYAQITPTDANGRYRVTGLSAGPYTVCFDGSASSGSGPDFDPGRAPRCWKAADPANPTAFTVALGRTTSGIAVREYRNATVAGRVVDPVGAPISKVWVVVDGVISGATDADGVYQLGVAPGDHTVCFDASQAVGSSKSGFVDQCWKAQPRFGGSPTPVHAGRGAQVTGIGATLALAAGVRVTVVDAHGTPLQHADVTLRGPNGGGPNATTDTHGVALFTRVYQGAGSDFQVYLGSDSYWNATPTAPHGYAPTGRAVTLRAGLQSVRVVAPAYGTLSGTVTGPDGAPVANAIVEVHGSSYVPSWSTGDDGTYAVPQLAPGTYTVCVSDWVGTGADQRYSTACWNGATDPATATPVVLGDRAEITGVDLRLS